MDDNKIKEGIRLFLEGIGENTGREGLLDTPDRIARMSHELFHPDEAEPAKILSKTFEAPSNDLIMERGILFHSFCEHHLLPFSGTADIAYLPAGRVVGLSKLARLLDFYSRRLQLQERLTAQVAEAIMEYLKPKGVYVRLEAEHSCMTLRGVKKPGTKTITIARRGADFKIDTNS